MPHKIEPAPSARARCRGCKEAIAKGAPRFAEEFQNPYSEDGGTSFRYWHLPCAARALANELAPVLASYSGAVEPDLRAEVDALVEANLRPEMPYAERAGTGRARCRACEVTIKKGEWRVAFERTFESPMGPQKGAAYAHLKCLGRYLERERERGRAAMDRGEAVGMVLSNSRLSPPDREIVERDLTP